MRKSRQGTTYIAVRLTEGREWLDISTVAALPEQCRDKILTVNRACGIWWSRDNPAVRIAPIRITELKHKIYFPVNHEVEIDFMKVYKERKSRESSKRTKTKGKAKPTRPRA